MAYKTVSANNASELLAQLVIFATEQGWSIVYDDSSLASPQIGLQKNGCNIAIGTQVAADTAITRTDPYNSQTMMDAVLQIVACPNALNPTNRRYWGHPGSTITAAGTGTNPRVNDIYGPMNVVEFFGGDTYIHVNILSAPNRYTSFGFGLTDADSMTVPRVSYAFGQYHSFWDGAQWTSSYVYRVKATISPLYSTVQRHSHLWAIGNYASTATSLANRPIMFCVPNGVLDTSVGFPSGIYQGNAANLMSLFQDVQPSSGNDGRPPVPASSSEYGFLMGFAYYIRAQPVTGGIPLIGIPLFLLVSGNVCYLGKIPDLAYVDVSTAEIGADYAYGPDTWLLYPMKQRGTRATANGPNYNNLPNSLNYGYGFKKVV